MLSNSSYTILPYDNIKKLSFFFLYHFLYKKFNFIKRVCIVIFLFFIFFALLEYNNINHIHMIWHFNMHVFYCINFNMFYWVDWWVTVFGVCVCVFENKHATYKYDPSHTTYTLFLIYDMIAWNVYQKCM